VFVNNLIAKQIILFSRPIGRLPLGQF